MSALAAPGQVLVEGSGLGLDEVAIAQREDSVVLLPPSEGEMLAFFNNLKPSCPHRFSFAESV